MDDILFGLVMLVIWGVIAGVIIYYLGKVTCGCLSVILMIFLCAWLFKKCSLFFA